ncbi:YceD family protein [Corynebacterium choanae]|uniref:DUF177 domain-containing protein n=1 Tax=Corynebacterium choanae TaxID=1862358 RepID=A0A3G6J7P5_9CORY|nr:YceD family protein [Corynebacterium choanae]AZA13909.1 hypothetical protein CCHOA_07585 [Corynebacterium choanae]
MNAPFTFDVNALFSRAATTTEMTQTGTAPHRIGSELLAIAADSPVTVTAILQPLGEVIMADATLSGTLTGSCARCLRPLEVPREFTINEVYTTEEAITTIGDEPDDEQEDAAEQRLIERGTIDLLQPFVDKLGLELPFSPTCEDFGLDCDEQAAGVRAPDAVEGEEHQLADPRWGGLEKFL